MVGEVVRCTWWSQLDPMLGAHISSKNDARQNGAAAQRHSSYSSLRAALLGEVDSAVVVSKVAGEVVVWKVINEVVR